MCVMKNVLWIVVLLVFVGGCATKQPVLCHQSDKSIGKLSKEETAQQKYILLYKQLNEHPWFQQDKVPSWDKDGNDLREDWYKVPDEHKYIVPEKHRSNAISMLEELPFVRLETKNAKSMLGSAGTGIFPPERYSFYLVRALSFHEPEHVHFNVEQNSGYVSVAIDTTPWHFDKLRKLPLIILLKIPPKEIYYTCIGLDPPFPLPPIPDSGEK